MRKLGIPYEHIYNGELLLVNDRHPLHQMPGKRWLVPACNGYSDILLHKRAAAQLQQLIQNIHAQETIVPVSGFQEYEEQVEIYEDCMRTEGIGYTTDFVALPGCSEHHTGLAIDVAEKKQKIDFICPEFPYEGICQTFREKASGYGFIERYQRGKEAVTHVAQEPWHFHYVGIPHAHIIKKKDLTLEEYIQYVKQFTQSGEHLIYESQDIRYEIFYIPLQEEGYEFYLEEEKRCIVSGNNIDGVIVNIW